VTDWRHHAACLGEDPELFFPIGNTGPALLQIRDAKAVCNRCPVIIDCGRWAYETSQDTGVWGGMSEDERRALKRKAARQRAATTPEPGRRYSPQQRQEAIDLYHSSRPMYSSASNCLMAVAKHLDIGHWHTVRDWLKAENPAQPI
jgi:WhiB family redox-sensing transcriptional regulator